MGRSFYIRASLFYLRLVFVAYGQLAWSFLFKVWSFCLWWKFGLVFFTYGSPPPAEIRFGLFCLRFPPVWKLGLVFFAYGSPTVSEKRRAVSKKTSLVSKKDASTHNWQTRFYLSKACCGHRASSKPLIHLRIAFCCTSKLPDPWQQLATKWHIFSKKSSEPKVQPPEGRGRCASCAMWSQMFVLHSGSWSDLLLAMSRELVLLILVPSLGVDCGMKKTLEYSLFGVSDSLCVTKLWNEQNMSSKRT